MLKQATEMRQFITLADLLAFLAAEMANHDTMAEQ